MRSINVQKLSYLPIAALILSGSSLLADPLASAVGPPAVQSKTSSPSSAEASQLLKEVRTIAYNLERDAATLESYTFGRLDWRTHADQLSLAREHINAIGNRLKNLQAIRSTAAPWQQQAIESIVPVATQLAARTEAAINHLNENRGYRFAPEYTDHLRTIADHSDQLKESVNVFLEMASTQEKLDRLREKAAALES
jgi:uncharacterized coiled-coil DUF342 family protein